MSVWQHSGAELACRVTDAFNYRLQFAFFNGEIIHVGQLCSLKARTRPNNLPEKCTKYSTILIEGLEGKIMEPI